MIKIIFLEELTLIAKRIDLKECLRMCILHAFLIDSTLLFGNRDSGIVALVLKSYFGDIELLLEYLRVFAFMRTK